MVEDSARDEWARISHGLTVGANQGQQYMGRMQEGLFWPRFTLINGICSLDSTFLLSLGAVSTLLLTDPSTAPSFCLSVPILLTGPPFGFLVKQGGTSQQIWSLLMKQEGTSQQKHIFWKQWDKKQPLTFITLSKNSSNVNTYALSDYSDLQNTNKLPPG